MSLVLPALQRHSGSRDGKNAANGASEEERHGVLFHRELSSEFSTRNQKKKIKKREVIAKNHYCDKL